MKKRILVLLAASLILTIACAVNAFAGEWRSDNIGWWWQNDDGSYPANCWQWIDGNNDGTAECYYFNPSGYCLMGTTTPDGYTVDPNGAWIVGGVVQTKGVAKQGTPAKEKAYTSNETAKAEKASNRDRVNLASLQVSAKRYADVVSSAETMYDGAYGKCIDSNYSSGYIEFYAGGLYETLHLSYAPKKGFSEDGVWILEVYGDDSEGDLLYSSDDINYRSHSKNADVDISGCEFIRIKFGKANYGGRVIAKGSVE